MTRPNGDPEERRRRGCAVGRRMPPLRLLREDLVTSGSRLGSAAFHALVMYRFGVWRDTLPSGPARKLLRLPYVLLHRHVRRRHRIELHYTAALGRRVAFSEAGHITIGNGAYVGDDCVIGPGVTLGRTDRGWPTIGRGVVLAPGATVLGEVQVGEEAVIGPNAVVIADVPAGATVSLRTSECRSENGAPSPRTSSDASLRSLRSRDVPVNVTVGPGSKTSRFSYAAFYGPVKLGVACRIREGVTIGWSPPDASSTRLTLIGSRVDLGAGVVVVAGVRIGDDAQVEPNVVVYEDIPAGTRVRAVGARSFSALGAGSSPPGEVSTSRPAN